MALGTPVVGFHRIVLAEQIAHGVPGVMVGRAAEVPHAIVTAAGLDAPRSARRRRAFDAGRMVEGYESLFQRLLQGRR